MLVPSFAPLALCCRSVTEVTLHMKQHHYEPGHTIHVASPRWIENHNFLEDHRFVPTCFILLCHKCITTVLHTGFLLLMHPLMGLSKCSWYKPSDKPWKQPAAYLVLSATRYERNVMAKPCRVTRQKPPWCLQQGRKYHIKIKARPGKSAHFGAEKKSKPPLSSWFLCHRVSTLQRRFVWSERLFVKLYLSL